MIIEKSIIETDSRFVSLLSILEMGTRALAAASTERLLASLSLKLKLGMLKSFFLENRLSFAENRFFLDYRFLTSK